MFFSALVKLERAFCQRNIKSHQPERVLGIISVRPDTSDTGETALFPELVTEVFYH